MPQRRGKNHRDDSDIGQAQDIGHGIKAGLLAARPDRCLERAARKDRGTYGGPWWADSDVYKWLEGASYVLGSNPNPALERRVDEVIARIGE